jgi:excisionase family DNA binding protein
MADKKLYSTTEAAAKAGISRDTLLRWLKDGKVPEPDRNRNRWRIFSERDVQAVIRYATHVYPSPRKAQGELFRKRQRA